MRPDTLLPKDLSRFPHCFSTFILFTLDFSTNKPLFCLILEPLIQTSSVVPQTSVLRSFLLHCHLFLHPLILMCQLIYCVFYVHCLRYPSHHLSGVLHFLMTLHPLPPALHFLILSHWSLSLLMPTVLPALMICLHSHLFPVHIVPQASSCLLILYLWLEH